MNNRTILIVLVDDNLGDIYLVREALAQSGLPYEAKVFTDGAGAQEYFLSCGQMPGRVPELIILDLNLPRVSGGQLLELVRSRAELQDVPVVVLSTSDAPKDRALADKTHSAMYLTKPSDLDSFLSVGKRIRAFWEGLQRNAKPVVAG